ncbi:MAG: YicC family protein [Prevotellaceae bacterium]|jgi:uncharacterized protein (TIGR00255 family)|nr:YicC family protein [Prevotellaceae bacterium]
MAVKSMTGYGKAETMTGNIKITVEIRSLNGKQMDVVLKSSQQYRALEMDVRKMVMANAMRGKIDICLARETVDGTTTAAFNAKAFKSYYNEISKATSELGVNLDSQNFVSAILRLPEVVVPDNDEITSEEADALLNCCAKALAAMDDFRIKEGEPLIADILSRIATIEQKLSTIEPFETARMDKVKQSIETALNQLKPAAEIDRNRFEQELIYYLEKMDITEEKVRLRQHCAFFRQTCASEEIHGRKLGFIAQEIGREINTIGAKAGDVDIQKTVVEMKDELEKIKEQTLNIL